MNVGDFSSSGPTTFGHGLFEGVQTLSGHRIALLHQVIEPRSGHFQLLRCHRFVITTKEPGEGTLGHPNDRISCHTENAAIGHIGDRSRTGPVTGHGRILELSQLVA